MSVDDAQLRLIKHDIKNQLSNIHLALDTLKHEVENPSEDFVFCVDTILQSATRIDQLLKPLDEA
jgi:nitrogen fixation/metabolism regulation signal transduction histidine kinase